MVGGDLETMREDVAWAEARSALSWWLEAGVDVALQEQSRDWLAPHTPNSKSSMVPTPPPNIVQPTQDTLAELQQWLATSVQLPLAGPAAKRILPHGPEQAPVMLISDSLTLEDGAAGKPIGGTAWDLTVRMLAAIGIDAGEAYSASLSCFHSPGARMSAAEREACADIARRHIALAKPKRLLLLGKEPCEALIGKPLTEARGHVHKVEGVRTVVTFHPRFLINHPSNKALAWKDLLLLMEGES